MAVVTAMHEDMHQRADEQHEPRQCAEEMGAVLGPEKPARDAGQREPTDAVARTPER
jgi:hypothetical protein